MGTILGMLSVKVFLVCVILYFVTEKITKSWVKSNRLDVRIAKLTKDYPWQVYAYALVEYVILIVGFIALLITISNL
jgi:hypothetical protein